MLIYMNKKEKSNKCIVITAPSGAGKTTVVRHLLARWPDLLGFSVSATNRPRRFNEKEGRDYYFLTTDEFQKKVELGAFVEYEEVYNGRYYGTLRTELERLWNQDKTIVFDIDVQGALKIKDNIEAGCLTIFVKPPNEKVLIDRLKRRKTETAEDLQMRIDKIRNELSYQNCFDKILVNDILEVTLKEAELMVEEFLEIKKE